MLVNYFTHKYPEQIKFRNIGEKNLSKEFLIEDEISKNCIHVFGANENNWNVKKIKKF